MPKFAGALLAVVLMGAPAAAQATLPFAESFDGGGIPAGWSVDPASIGGVQWAADATPAFVADGSGDGFSLPGAPVDPSFVSAPNSLNINDGSTFDDGVIDQSATSPAIDVTGAPTVSLSFQCNYETEDTGTTFDLRQVEILDDATLAVLGTCALGEFGSTVPNGTCATRGSWHSHNLNITPPPGITTIRLRFHFDSVDTINNFYNGWFIDDVSIVSNPGDLAPEAPTNVAPPDGAVIAAGPVILDWTDARDDTTASDLDFIPGGNIASYDVQVATDAGFASIVFSATVVPSTATTTPLAAGAYFWRARATDVQGNVGAFSTATTFTCIVPVPLPYTEGFDAGAPSGWSVSAPSTEGVAWDFDATPANVGDGTGVCGGAASTPVDPSTFGGTAGSLNYNDGTDYEDTTDGFASGSATSPLLDSSTSGGSVLISFQCNYETDTPSFFFDTRTVDVLDAGAGTTIVTHTFATDGSGSQLCAAMGTYHLHSITVPTAATSIQVRWNFSTVVGGSDDCYSGWFIDELNVTCGDSVPPPAPTLLSPASGSVVVVPPGVFLDWTDVVDTSGCGPGTVANYVVEVDDDPAFGSINFTASPAVSNATTGILAPATYNWRARAVDTGGNVGPNSAVFTFTIEAPMPPLPPDTLFVNESSQGAQSGVSGFVDPVVDRQPALSAIYRDANTFDSATALRFQVSADPTFTVLDFDSGPVTLTPILAKDARCPDQIVGVELQRDTVYFWRIQFTDVAGLTGPFSVAQSFHIGDDFDFGVRRGSSNHSRRCFVATAVFGGETSEVRNLISWRTATVETSGAGRVFARTYHSVGPLAAAEISALPGTCRAGRSLLSAASTGAAHPGFMALSLLLAMSCLAVAAVRRL